LNLDMMAGVCHLLSTRLDSIWNYSLQDGPGMRAAIAFHFPFIADRSSWPYRADRDHFKELPARRASLLLSARAYERPEYAALWKTLPADPPTPAILRTLPIHQPLLWVRQPAPTLRLARTVNSIATQQAASPAVAAARLKKFRSTGPALPGIDP
jgi:hypothetical protein